MVVVSLDGNRRTAVARLLQCGQCDGLREAAYGAFVADEAVAFDLDAEEQSVVVAVGGGGDDAEAVAAGLAFHPEFVAGAAPEGDEAGFESLLNS